MKTICSRDETAQRQCDGVNSISTRESGLLFVHDVKLKKVTLTYTLFEYKILQNNFQGTTRSFTRLN